MFLSTIDDWTKVTWKGAYPLPQIDDVLDTLQGSDYFSSMDLCQWTTSQKQLSSCPTNFIISMLGRSGCAMRLLHLSSWWTRCYAASNGQCASSTLTMSSFFLFPEHIRRLCEVLGCFRATGLQLNSMKCFFGTREMQVLGQVMSAACQHTSGSRKTSCCCQLSNANPCKGRLLFSWFLHLFL